MSDSSFNPFEMEPSDESEPQDLALGRDQGAVYERVVKHMADTVADDGGQKEAGDYLVGYAVEKAEGMWMPQDGELVWREPEEENVHIEVVVQDAADRRFVPGLNVRVTVYDPEGKELGTHQQPMLWHPWLHHYGRNWKVPAGGEYRLKVHIDPLDLPRHDRKNGNRFKDPVDVEFSPVKIRTGRG